VTVFGAWMDSLPEIEAAIIFVCCGIAMSLVMIMVFGLWKD